jgi:hypothetical protein
MLKSKEASKFAPGDLVFHINRPQERYKLTMVFECSAWAIRQSDEAEVMLLIENLTSCR